MSTVLIGEILSVAMFLATIGAVLAGYPVAFTLAVAFPSEVACPEGLVLDVALDGQRQTADPQQQWPHERQAPIAVGLREQPVGGLQRQSPASASAATKGVQNFLDIMVSSNHT